MAEEISPEARLTTWPTLAKGLFVTSVNKPWARPLARRIS